MAHIYKGKFRVSQIQHSSHDGLDLVGVDGKNIYSNVDGVVEVAGWENANNTKQGFGKYIRIKKTGSTDKYYFGHLSEIKVKVGQTVKVGDLIGVEGSTGYSTGSHCHFCVRVNGSKTNLRKAYDILGIKNAIGTYEGKIETSTTSSSTSYTAGKTYTLKSNVKVRKTASIKGAQKKVSELTADGKKYATSSKSSDLAVLKSGTKVTCQAVSTETVGGVTYTWIKVPSGYICAKEGSSAYIS